MTELEPKGPWAWLARILRPQGRKGEVFAEILTDFPEKFAERRRLWLLPRDGSPSPDPHPVKLSSHWLHKGGIVLHFAGIGSISEAEELKGLVVAIPGAERAPLGEGEVFISDLIGCTLVDLAGGKPVELGEIEGVDRTAGPVPLLVVRNQARANAGELLIPFAKSYLRRIDLDARRVEMALPEGLLDLNA